MKIHRRTGAGLALAASLLFVTGAGAEEAPLARPGVRVRITGGDAGHFLGTATGLLVDAGPDGITLVTQEGVLKLPAASITRVEVSHGRKRHGWRGLLVGLGAGALIGLALTYDPEVGCGYEYYVPCTTSKRVGSAVTGAFGFGLVGGAVGLGIRTEAWSDAPVARLRVAVVPEEDGGQVAFTLSF